MSVVKLDRRGTVGVIRVDNPPVNAISQAVRQGLYDAIIEISGDDTIKSAILICEGRTFMAGADASELGKSPVPPHLNDLVVHIESCPKPIAAAIHGQALGGGLEIALGCSHRVAVDGANFGLPEVTLGFVPGAGGTQRLPRLIGVEAALKMAVEGRPINSQAALKSGLIDRIATSLEDDTVALADEVAGTDMTARKLNRPIDAGSFNAEVFDEWRANYTRRKRGVLAPQAVIDAVEAAATKSFQEGLDKERALSLELRKHPQSTALRHIFFAERASSKVDGVDLKSAAPIQSVAVIGAGTMGAGIAQFFAMNKIPVTLVEISEEAAAAGIERVAGNIAQSIKRGKMSEAAGQEILARITPTTDYADMAQLDLVIEAAVENMEIKKKIFQQLDETCKPETILSTNTSYLDINEIAQATNRPGKVVGLHFFSPAHVMKLVEIVRTDGAEPGVIASLTAMMKKLGKIGVIAGVCHGFIGNRMYQCYQREAGLLLLETGSPEAVDAAMRQYGMAMGPFQVLDLSGIDIGYLMRKALPPGSVHPHAFQVHDRLVEMDRKGRKSGAGFYLYGEDGASSDDLVRDMIREEAAKAGIGQREVTVEDIAARCVKALADEGEKILAEGIAAKPGDIDVVFVNGYGFPRHQGGPMHYQSTVSG